jgi:hypothetical protein
MVVNINIPAAKQVGVAARRQAGRHADIDSLVVSIDKNMSLASASEREYATVNNLPVNKLNALSRRPELEHADSRVSPVLAYPGIAATVAIMG